MRGLRDSTSAKLQCLGSSDNGEPALLAHNLVPGEALRNCRAVHIILLIRQSDTEPGEVIVQKPVQFRGLVTRSHVPTGRGRALWVAKWETVIKSFAITLEDRIK